MLSMTLGPLPEEFSHRLPPHPISRGPCDATCALSAPRHAPPIAVVDCVCTGVELLCLASDGLHSPSRGGYGVSWVPAGGDVVMSVKGAPAPPLLFAICRDPSLGWSRPFWGVRVVCASRGYWVALWAVRHF